MADASDLSGSLVRQVSVTRCPMSLVSARFSGLGSHARFYMYFLVLYPQNGRFTPKAGERPSKSDPDHFEWIWSSTLQDEGPFQNRKGRTKWQIDPKVTEI